MKIKIVCVGNWIKSYNEPLKKYNPIKTTLEYYPDAHNEYQLPAYLIDIPSLAIIPELAEELQENIIYCRGLKEGEEGYQEPHLLIYDDYVE